MKKSLFSLAALATLVFAAPVAYNYEVTPTIGGVLPEGNLNLDGQLTYGLRFGINLDDSIISQIELGYDRSDNVDYKHSTKETDFNRYYANLVKEYKMTPETALYALVGLGYEDITNEAFKNDDSMFAQYGGGVKYWVTDTFALKAEVRHAIKFDHGDNNLFYSLGFTIPLSPKTAPVVAKVEPKPAPVAAPIAPKDSDMDGVYDDKDKCPNTPAGTVVDADGCTKIIRLHVTFDFDKSTVKSEFMPQIQKVADFMKQNPGYRVVLEGHTDSKGSDAYNMKLSDQRAKAVAKALSSLGVVAAKVSTEAYGESKPVATNDTEAGRAENRRVDALFKK
ncbi:OmpA family protein [Sulfurospirillum barnesii]|uniref:Outer membrane protein/peptidoglycan-associated (Lipo)protein n=1 Tax=Sulfurospirillum barnesii (strain ATCC 700032 / DSM 10660 / SES-3) TaxID=760154 RepID=I3XZC0_SULBS|nr:OmpA family protein [Sulfurospirillum barnesii]AFL69294.1 outer membrane protein/peptidoglycan-associated (lipo)protein [Sulfurospirillum barnesii SES-3]